MIGKFTSSRLIMLAAVPLFLILISIYFYFVNTRYVTTDDACIKIGISSLSPQVNGIVSKVHIKNTQNIKKGDIILTLDQASFNINLEAAEAGLSSTINQIQNLKSGYYAKQAILAGAKADLAFYQKQYTRIKELLANKAISQNDLDIANHQLDNSTQNLNNIEETIKQQLASLDGDAELPIEKHALYLQAKSQLDKANLDLKNTVIYAPFDGMIANLYTKAGNYAAEGVPLVSIIDSNDIWVEANFKETEVTDIKPGQKATIKIDSFPDEKIDAKVIGITKATGSEFSILPAQNSSGNWVKITQRINVRLELLEKPQISVSSGMSAIVTIDTKSL